MKISCGLPPGKETIELALLAEELGYERVWLYDSPALYEDIWTHLGILADRTSKIGLGTAVLVPHLKHPMAMASSLAAVQRISEGRLACAFGTGFTARMVMNKKALTWKFMETYLRQLKGLLAGEVVEIEGEKCQMAHGPRWAPERPIDVPILLSAFGPKGTGIAKELADGLMGIGPGDGSFDWHVHMMNGTVLDAGESPLSDRAKEAAGPWYVLAYHGMFVFAREALGSMPGGGEWLKNIEAERPEDERHLVVHQGHATDLTDRDRPLMEAAGDDLKWNGWVDEAEGIKTRAAESEQAGTSELLYTPAGPDIAREMKAFIEVFK